VKVLSVLRNVTLLFILANNSYANEKQVQKYVKIFEGESWNQQLKACNEFQWLGMSDTRVFDLIEQKVKDRYTSSNRRVINNVAWYMKALGFSGNEKYVDTLKMVAAKTPSKKLRKYAREGIMYQELYVKWNPIIRDTSHFDKNQTPRINRFANMLRSGEWQLMRVAAKRIHYEHLYEPYILNVLMEEFREGVNQGGDSYVRDAYKWMVKAVAGSGVESYREQLLEVSDEVKSSRMKKHIHMMVTRYY